MKLNGGHFTLSTYSGGKTKIISSFVEVTSAVFFFCPDAKVLVLICGSSSLSKQDEASVEKVVKDFVNDTEKIVTGWLKHGIIDLEPDVFAQLLIATSDVTRRGPNQGNYPERGLQSETNRQVQRQQPRGATANYPATTEGAHQGTAILKCELYGGQISVSDLNFLKQSHDSKVVESIDADLYDKYKAIPLASVEFLTDTYGYLRYTVEIRSTEDPDVEGVKIFDNETLMLSTLVRFGDVSFLNEDVKFYRKGFEIPQEIVRDIKGKCELFPKVGLLVVCDEKGISRCKYITGALNKLAGGFNRMRRSLRNPCKK